MASYYISYTSDSVTFLVTGLSPGQDVRFYVRKDPNPGQAVVDKTFYSASASITKTFYGLEGGTSYAVNVQPSETGKWIGTKTFTTPEDAPPFIPFDWTYAGLDSAGDPVWGTKKRAGLGVYVTAAEWNELAGLVKDQTGKSVRTVSPGTAISAAIVNSMAQALGMWEVSRGDEMTADFFNSLRLAYNALG